MPAILRNENDGRLIKLCAKEYQVSERTVANWRKAGDERWTEWKRLRKPGRPPNPKEEPPPLPDIEDDGFGEGITAEIFRLMSECKRLAHKAAQLEQVRDFDASALVHRILEQKRDSLRKLAKDNPDIMEKAGDLIPKSILMAYASRLKMTLESIPRRLLAVVPEDQREKIKPLLETEVASICKAVQEIDLNK